MLSLSYMSMYSDALQLFGNQIVAIDQNLVLTLEIAVTIYEHRTQQTIYLK